MKKFIIYLLIAMLALGLTACSNKQKEENGKEPAVEGEEPDTTMAAEKSVSLSTADLAEVIRNSIEFPVLMPQETQNEIETFAGVDFALVEEITLFQQALTVHLVEIMVIRPAEGKMGEVMEFLEARKAKLIEDVAFYPGQEMAAEATVFGNRHYIAYLICHEDAAIAEEALMTAINENIQ